jgi:hypothetical protein
MLTSPSRIGVSLNIRIFSRKNGKRKNVLIVSFFPLCDGYLGKKDVRNVQNQKRNQNEKVTSRRLCCPHIKSNATFLLRKKENVDVSAKKQKVCRSPAQEEEIELKERPFFCHLQLLCLSMLVVSAFCYMHAKVARFFSGKNKNKTYKVQKLTVVMLFCQQQKQL